MIQFRCFKCGYRFNVPDDFAGGSGECNGCGTKVQVPKSPHEPPISPPLEDGSGTLDRGLADAGGQTGASVGMSDTSQYPAMDANSVSLTTDAIQHAIHEARRPPPLPSTKSCPSCSAQLDRGAVLCTSCGYSVESKKTMKTHREIGHSGRDPFGRTPPLAGGLAPRYFGIRFIAALLIIAGVITLSSGIVVIVTSLFLVESEADAVRSEMKRLKKEHSTQRVAEAEEIEALSTRLADANEDIREQLSDRVQQTREVHRRKDTRRRTEMDRIQQRLASAETTSDHWAVRLGGAWGGFLIVVSGIITVGIGQVFGAFRDMAINSYVLADR